MNPFSDEYFMRKALLEAEKAFDLGEVPIGVIVVVNDIIIAKTHNLTQRLKDVTAHAEMLAITAASEYLQGKYLTDCTMYITLEPCAMCAGALYWSQIGKIVFAASDSKRGFRVQNGKLHPKTKIQEGILSQESEQLLKKFFEQKRN